MQSAELKDVIPILDVRDVEVALRFYVERLGFPGRFPVKRLRRTPSPCRYWVSRLTGRSAGVLLFLGFYGRATVAHFAHLDTRAQAEIASARRSDTPTLVSC